MADTQQMLFDRLDRLTAALEGGALGGGAGGGAPFRTLAGSLNALPEPYRVLPPDGADASKGFLRPKPGGPAAAAPRSPGPASAAGTAPSSRSAACTIGAAVFSAYGPVVEANHSASTDASPATRRARRPASTAMVTASSS